MRSPEPAELMLFDTDEGALEHGVFVAAHDIVSIAYGSPYAEVYVVARDLEHIGDAYATDAPWKWAHPAVEEAAAEEVAWEVEHEMLRGGGRTI